MECQESRLSFSELTATFSARVLCHRAEIWRLPQADGGSGWELLMGRYLRFAPRGGNSSQKCQCKGYTDTTESKAGCLG